MSCRNENRSGYKKTKIGWIPEEWQDISIHEVSKVVTGSTPNSTNEKYYGSEFLFVGPGDLDNIKYVIKSKKNLSQAGSDATRKIPKGSSLFTCIGSTIGKMAIAGEILSTNQQINAVIPNSKIAEEFLYYSLLKLSPKIKSLASEQAVPIVNKTEFSAYKIPLPPLSEQKKIAEILSTWDMAIEKTEKLIKKCELRKKGLVQRLYKSYNNENNSIVPLGDIFEEVTDKVGDQEIYPYSISAGIGFVSQKEKWGKNIAGKQYENYIHLRRGDFAYNKGNSKKYKCGCIYLLEEHNEISVPNVFISFRSKNNMVCSSFYKHYFIADRLARQLKRWITSGARSDGLLNLSKKDFFKTLLPFPPIEEQKKIATILDAADKEISKLKAKRDALNKQKKGLMKKLLTGEVRHPDFV